MGGLADIISTGLRSPNLQVENPMAAYQQYQQGQAAKAEATERDQATQTQQQQQQLTALQIQEAQQQQQSQQALMRAYTETGGNAQQAIPLAMKYGATPQTVQAFQTSQTALQKSITDLGKDQLDLHNKHTAEALNTVGPLAQLPPDQMAQQWGPAISGLLASHDIAPEDLAKIGVDPNTPPDPSHLKLLVSTLSGYQQGIANEQKNREVAAQEVKAQADAATSGATVAEKNAETTQKTRALDAAALATAAKQGPAALQGALEALPYGRAKVFEGVTDPTQITRLGMTPEEQTRADQTKAQQDATNKYHADTLQLGRDRLNQQGGGGGGGGAPVPGVTPAAGSQQLSGDDYLKSLPVSFAAQVKAIAEGRDTMPNLPRGANANSLQAQIRSAVYQYDPGWSQQAAQVRKSFTTGADGKNIGNLNTAPGHLDQLGDMAQAMGNGTFVPGNAVVNAAKAMFGDSAPTNFGAVRTAVAGEMASALKGNATDQEIRHVQENISAAGSPQQLKGVIDENLKLLGAKLNTYQERYNQANPNDKNWSPVLPSAKAVFQKHGINPTAGPSAVTSGGNAGGGVSVKAPNGKTYTFKSQSDADTFKKNAGIQ